MLPRPLAIIPATILLILLQLATLENAALAADIVEFLFQNQRICGEPFADAQWVPVLDLCELECKAEEEICMEDDQMKQSCRKLPAECTRAFRAQQAANLRKGIVQMDKKNKPNEGKKQLATTLKPTQSTIQRPAAAIVGKNSAAAISALSQQQQNGEGGPNILARSARRKKQSRRKLRANAGGKTRQIVKTNVKGKRNGEPKKIVEMRRTRNGNGKRAVAGKANGGMRLRQRQWRGIEMERRRN